jgi:hypothetical protein
MAHITGKIKTTGEKCVLIESFYQAFPAGYHTTVEIGMHSVKVNGKDREILASDFEIETISGEQSL